MTKHKKNTSFFPFKSITITGVHGKENKEIVADLLGEIRIFVSENGSGKTTVLKILNSLLNKNLVEILSIRWNKISLVLSDDSNYEIKRKDVISKIIRDDTKENINIVDNKLRDFLEVDKRKRFRRSFMREFRYDFGYDTYTHLDKFIENIDEENTFNNLFKDKWDRKNTKFLSTYRRVEDKVQLYDEDGDPIFYDYSNSENNTLRFGMEDIEKKLKGKVQALKNDFSSGFQDLGKKLFDEFTKEKISVKNVNLEDAKKILPRLKDNLDGDVFSEVQKYIDREDKSKNNPHLDLMLSQVQEIYKKTDDDNTLLNDFCSTVSSYLELSKKELYYDQTKVEYRLKYKDDNERINFSDLSSGEQQMLSMLADVYFEKEEFVLIIDEPEISLSLKWQKMILNDLINAINCKKLIVATHSPHIFPNDYEKCVSALKVNFN